MISVKLILSIVMFLIGSFSEFCMETKLHIYHPDFSRVSHLSSYCKLIKAAILQSCSITDNFCRLINANKIECVKADTFSGLASLNLL